MIFIVADTFVGVLSREHSRSRINLGYALIRFSKGQLFRPYINPAPRVTQTDSLRRPAPFLVGGISA